MRISQLSRRTGIPVATIKYYLREGLLAPGDGAGAKNQAEYTEGHVHRLHLVRTLLQIGGLSVAATRETVRALEDPGLDRHHLIGTAHTALPRHRLAATAAPSDDLAAAHREVTEFLTSLGWPEAHDDSQVSVLSEALAALRRLGRDVGPEVFQPYAEAADALAAQELAALDPAGEPERMVEDVVVGTVVFEAVLTALRRLAHAKHSAERFGGKPAPVRARG